MFDTDKFGQRLQDARKKKGMTQEELATRMGISAQAVSKWETGLSYPDITTIPTLAALLDMDIAELFGQEAKPKAKKSHTFAEFHNGLPLVHAGKDTACYSDKSVASATDDFVKFTDSTTADLVTKTITNKGKGEIHLVDAITKRETTHDGNIIESKEFEFDFTNSVEGVIRNCDVEILRSNDSKTRINAQGTKEFLSNLKIEAKKNTLIFDIKNPRDLGNRIFGDRYNDRHSNKLTISLPCEKGDLAKLKIEGSGTVSSIENFAIGEFSVSGSGIFKMNDFDEFCSIKIGGSGGLEMNHTKKLDIDIGGSGNVSCTHAEKLNVKIGGSGAVTCQSAHNAQLDIGGSGVITLPICNDVSLKIAGSGAADFTKVHNIDISIAGSGSTEIHEITGGNFSASIAGNVSIDVTKGNCENFNLTADGNCGVEASGLTARNAHIVLKKDGEVTLGRVIESSVEQIKKKGTIKILARGNE